MKRKIRERSAGCKSSGAPTDRIEHNGTARSKRRANGLAAIGLAGILAAGMGLTGCQNYESSSEMKARIQSEGGEASGRARQPSGPQLYREKAVRIMAIRLRPSNWTQSGPQPPCPNLRMCRTRFM